MGEGWPNLVSSFRGGGWDFEIKTIGLGGVGLNLAGKGLGRLGHHLLKSIGSCWDGDGSRLGLISIMDGVRGGIGLRVVLGMGWGCGWGWRWDEGGRRWGVGVDDD